MGAADGTLAIMVGGADEAFAACAEPFALMGSEVVHCGPVGCRHRGRSWPATCCTSSRSPPPARRSGWPRRPGSTWSTLGQVVRHTDAITGGPGRDHAPRHDRAAAAGRRLVRRSSSTCGRSARRTSPRHRAGRPARRRRTAGAARARPPRPPDWDSTRSRSDVDDRRASGSAGWTRWPRSTAATFQDGPGDFFGYTADHLFADIWSRPGLDTAQRRLLLIGMLAAQGADDVLASSSRRRTPRGELDADGLREIVVFLAHYAGWPVARAAEHGRRVGDRQAQRLTGRRLRDDGRVSDRLYVPRFNQMPDDDVRAFVAGVGTAQLVTVAEDGTPDATFLPVLWCGDRLVGHVARANRHWRADRGRVAGPGGRARPGRLREPGVLRDQARARPGGPDVELLDRAPPRPGPGHRRRRLAPGAGRRADRAPRGGRADPWAVEDAPGDVHREEAQRDRGRRDGRRVGRGEDQAQPEPLRGGPSPASSPGSRALPGQAVADAMRTALTPDSDGSSSTRRDRAAYSQSAENSV